MAKIGLDAGHYVGDGRVDKAFRAALGTNDEYTLNLRVYQVVERLLKAAGHTVVDIGRQEQSVVVRAQRAAHNGCDLVVSIHHNAGRGRGATLYRHKNGAMGAKSKKLQEALYAHIVKVNKGNRSTPINTAEFGVINCNTTGCPAVLIECAFMDNEADVTLINSAGYADRMGAAIAAGINDYTGVKNSDAGSGSVDKPASALTVEKVYSPAAYAKVKGLTKDDPYLNVRSGPGTSYGVIRQLANGNEVDVLATYTNGWALISIVGQQGYVNASYLSIGETQAVKQTVTVTGCTALNIRKTPNGPVVAGTVKAGIVLEVIGSGKDSDGDVWTQVRYGSLVGFVWPKYTS